MNTHQNAGASLTQEVNPFPVSLHKSDLFDVEPERDTQTHTQTNTHKCLELLAVMQAHFPV